MTTILELVRGKLLADTVVAGLVGARIYPQVIPQSEAGRMMPAVVISVLTDVPFNAFLQDPTNRLRNAQVQIDSYAPDYLAAHEVADAVNAVVAGLEAATLSAARVNSEDLYENETQLHRVSSDYAVVAST